MSDSKYLVIYGAPVCKQHEVAADLAHAFGLSKVVDDSSETYGSVKDQSFEQGTLYLTYHHADDLPGPLNALSYDFAVQFLRATAALTHPLTPAAAARL